MLENTSCEISIDITLNVNLKITISPVELFKDNLHERIIALHEN